MFSSKLRQCLVILGVVFLCSVGYYFYNSHVEFRDFMSAHFQFEKTYLGTDAKIPQHSLDNSKSVTNEKPDWSTYNKQEWEAYWSNQKPVKVRYAQTGMPDDGGVKTVPNESPPKSYSKANLVPQLVETPDGQMHKMYWFEKLKPGQAVPPPHEWSFADNVIVEGVMYDVPEGETTDSYSDKIRLSTMYDVPLESVDSLIKEGVIPSTPAEAQDDPLLDDPLFVKREDSRPLEARSAQSLSDWGISDDEWKEMIKPRPIETETELVMRDGEMALIDAETGEVIMSGDELDETEGVSSGKINSEQVPVADDFDTVLADALEKPKLPQSMFPPENPLTVPSTEADVAAGVSPKDLDKAEAQVNQHSTQERLRRLQELWEFAPDAVQQFERERSPKPPRDVFEGEESER